MKRHRLPPTIMIAIKIRPGNRQGDDMIANTKILSHTIKIHKVTVITATNSTIYKYKPVDTKITTTAICAQATPRYKQKYAKNVKQIKSSRNTTEYKTIAYTNQTDTQELSKPTADASASKPELSIPMTGRSAPQSTWRSETSSTATAHTLPHTTLTPETLKLMTGTSAPQSTSRPKLSVLLAGKSAPQATSVQL